METRCYDARSKYCGNANSSQIAVDSAAVLASRGTGAQFSRRGAHSNLHHSIERSNWYTHSSHRRTTWRKSEYRVKVMRGVFIQREATSYSSVFFNGIILLTGTLGNSSFGTKPSYWHTASSVRLIITNQSPSGCKNTTWCRPM